MRPRFWTQPRRDRGASSIELAILAPLVITLTMLFVQTAIWFHAREVAQTSVDQGARAARAFDGSQADGDRATRDFFARANGPNVTQDGVSITARRGPETASIRMQTTGLSVVPGLKFKIDVVAGGPVERFVPPTP